MSRIVPEYIRGLIVSDPAFNAASRSEALSTATEGSQIPGGTRNTNDSAMIIEQAGASWEGETLDLTCLRTGGAGAPGASAARMKWSGQAPLSGTSERGWLPMNVVTGWMELDSDATRDSGAAPAIGDLYEPAALRLLSGKVLVAFSHETGGTEYIGCVRFDPETGGGYDPSFGRFDSGLADYVWSNRDAYTWIQDIVSVSDTVTVPATPTLLQLPSGRVLCLFTSLQSYYGGAQYYAVGMAWSDDEGDTWTLEQVDTGARITLATGAPYRLSCVYSNGYLTLVMAHDAGGGSSNFVHWYSADVGGSWTLVESDPVGADTPWNPTLIACDDGSVLCFFVKITSPASVGGLYASRKLVPAGGFGGAEFQVSPANALSTTYAQGQDRLSACLGDDHTIHVLINVAEQSGVSGWSERVRYLRFPQSVSANGEAIQIPYPENTVEADALDYADGSAGSQIPLTRTCVPWGERLLSLWSSATITTKGQFFGGFSSIDWNGPTWAMWNEGATTRRYGVWWDNTYGLSTLAAWTLTGAGVEGTSPEGGLEWNFSGGASTRYAERLGDAGASVVVWARHRQDSGGSLSADDSAIRLRSANGTSDYDITVRFTTTAIRMVDNNNAGATIGTDATGLTASNMIDVLISLGSTGRCVVWYKAATSQIWIQGPSGNATNDGATPAATSYLRWGHWASSTQHSTWLHLGSSLDAAPPYPAGVIEPNNPNRISFGAEVSIWPQYLSDGRRYRATSTPARTGEAWKLFAASPYAVDHLDPTAYSSPGVVWRSATDSAAQGVVWDRTETDQPLSAAIGLYLRGANFLSLEWEWYDNVGASWETIASVDTVAITGDFARSGYLVTPAGDDGSITVARDELRGSWAVLEDGASPGDFYYRRIASNSPGGWTNGADALGIVLRLEGDMSTLPTTGTIQIIAPELAVVVNGAAALASDRWRVRIPARTYVDADQDYHTAAKLLIGPYIGFGQPYAWGRTMGMEPIQAIADAPNRRRSVRVLQRRPLRSAELPFTDPILAMDIYGATPVSVALASTGPPLAFRSDPRMVEDLLLQAEGARYPVVYLPVLTPPGGTVTRRDLLMYGRIMGASVRTAPIGKEGVLELQTIGTLRIEEEG